MSGKEADSGKVLESKVIGLNDSSNSLYYGVSQFARLACQKPCQLFVGGDFGWAERLARRPIQRKCWKAK